MGNPKESLDNWPPPPLCPNFGEEEFGQQLIPLENDSTVCSFSPTTVSQNYSTPKVAMSVKAHLYMAVSAEFIFTGILIAHSYGISAVTSHVTQLIVYVILEWRCRQND
jgi:hypothetical protein